MTEPRPHPRPRVANIPAGVPFVDSLAAGILQLARQMQDGPDDPLALARITVLLPTRRSIRSLREAFLRLGGGAPLLLPRLMPLGELDEESLLIADESLADAGVSDWPPAVSGLRRELLLTQLVCRLGARSLPQPPDEAQAARLAQALARLLDEIQTERCEVAKLKDLAPDAYAQHWQQTLQFLTILTEHWPQILEVEGALDPAERRNAMIGAQAEMWRRQPPADPVIAAGSTGSIPATADLLAVIASLPQGWVVLPGLDARMTEACWRALPAGHPQYGLMRLLDHLKADRDEVIAWPSPLKPVAPAGRAELVGAALDPVPDDGPAPSFADLPDPTKALDGVLRLDCPGPQEEAGAIALLMRETAEQGEDKTAALITPDRDLARRVAAELRRWNLEVDDSAGRPLSTTPVGAFLRLALGVCADDVAPVPLLSLLKHPLAAAGEAAAAFRRKARDLELAVLRGPRPAPGFTGLLQALEGAALDADGRDPRRRERLDALAGWLERLHAASHALCELLASRDAALGDILRAHIAWVEYLAASDSQSGAERLWRGDDGEAMANFIAELSQAARDFPPMKGRAYPSLFQALMTGRAVRPRFGTHPRLFIWGLLEARLQHADLVILGGLNESSWPPEVPADPWMSRPMREAFGLPSPERRIGLAAHDFAQAFAAPRVALTRASRVEGTPTVPARWLQRLDNLLAAMGKPEALKSDGKWLAWQRLLDQPESVRPMPRPAPRPPVSARPRKLSVTQVETWMRDPYGVYARHVLRLRALDPLDADPGLAERGNFIHAALDAFVRDWRPGESPEQAYRRLVDLGRQAFAPAIGRPGVWAFWWPRFLRIAEWFSANEIERRRIATPLAVEGWGEATLARPGGAFTLVAKADRIDRLGDGSLAMIDYKTGTAPSPREMDAGFAPQLPLEAAMAARGAFAGVPAASVGEIAVWRLTGGLVAGEEKPYKDAARLAESAWAGLERLIDRFDDPATAYLARPRDEAAPRYSDYEHLARIQEWANGGGDGDGGAA